MELHDYGQNDDRYCFQQYWDLSLILVTLLSHAYCAGFGTLENSFQGGRHLFCVDHFPKPSPLICLLDIHLWINVIGWWFQSVYKLNFKTDQADVGWFALAPIGGGFIKLQCVMFFRELNRCYFVMQKNTTALFDFFLVNITWPKIFPNNRTSPLPSFCSRHLFFVGGTPITVHVGVSSSEVCLLHLKLFLSKYRVKVF